MNAPPSLPLAAVLVGLLLAAPAGAQDPAYDDTPSEPAALGFVRGNVDQRMLSLPGQSVLLMSGTVTVTLSNQVGVRETIAYDTRMDFSTGQTSVVPPANPPALEPRWRAAADEAVRSVFALVAPPSASTTDFVMRLERDGDQVRIRCHPRLQGSAYDMTMWFTEDGTLLRKQVKFAGPDGKPDVSEHTYEHRIVGAHSVLTGETIVIDGLTRVSRYEYEDQSGILVLSRITSEGVLAPNVDEGRWMRLPVTVTVDVAAKVALAGG